MRSLIARPGSALILCLALVVVVPPVLALKAEYDQARAPVFRIPIQGYDPRNLLYGHYLTFQYRWHWAETAPEMATPREAQLCLRRDTAAPTANPKVSLYSEGVTTDCAARLHGIYRTGSFTPGRRGEASPPQPRFYVNEYDALRLEDILRSNQHQVSAEIAVINGEARPLRLFVGDIPAEDFIGKRR